MLPQTSYLCAMSNPSGLTAVRHHGLGGFEIKYYKGAIPSREDSYDLDCTNLGAIRILQLLGTPCFMPCMLLLQTRPTTMRCNDDCANSAVLDHGARPTTWTKGGESSQAFLHPNSMGMLPRIASSAVRNTASLCPIYTDNEGRLADDPVSCPRSSWST